MRGRKPVPTRLKIMRGNPGKRRLNDAEPKPMAGIPECPSHLDDVAKEFWTEICSRLDEMNLSTTADASALELMAATYSEWRTARAEVLKHGATYDCCTDSGVIVRARPEVQQASDAMKRLRSFLVEFGLTPSSRTKLTVTNKRDVDPFEEFLKRGKKSG